MRLTAAAARAAARLSRCHCCARRAGAGASRAASMPTPSIPMSTSMPLIHSSPSLASTRRVSLAAAAAASRPLSCSATAAESSNETTSNRGGTAETSTSASAAGVDGTETSTSTSLPLRQKRMRLDEAASLAAGPSVSRTVLQSWIARGKVFVDGQRCTKAGTSVSPRSVVEVRATEEKFVCRGGLKLDAALTHFEIDVAGLNAIDCGLSTGGFADCLLQRKVKSVLGVDVGYGQTSEKIRRDPRLFALERTNARRLVKEMLPRGAPRSYDIATLDVSFISVLKILPAISSLLEEDAQLVILVKPQFEAGKASVGAGGVVRSERVREEVLASVVAAVPAAAAFSTSSPFRLVGEGGEDDDDFVAPSSSSSPPPPFELMGTMESPIRGATSGNVEYLAHFRRKR